MYLVSDVWRFCLFQRSRAFPGLYSEGSEGQTGGGAQICGAAEETVRLNILSISCCMILFCFFGAVYNTRESFEVQTLKVIAQDFSLP